MQTEFPKSENQFLKAAMFQDQEIPLTYKGWEKKANEDIPPKNGKLGISWKQRLKYVLRYSYPEFALDEAGEKILGKGNEAMKNRNYDPAFPKGYSIKYHFAEGVLESGSLPLFNAFCLVRPAAGDIVVVNRTGEGQETKWRVTKLKKGEIHAWTGELPTIDYSSPEYSGDPEVNHGAYEHQVGD